MRESTIEPTWVPPLSAGYLSAPHPHSSLGPLRRQQTSEQKSPTGAAIRAPPAHRADSRAVARVPHGTPGADFSRWNTGCRSEPHAKERDVDPHGRPDQPVGLRR